MISENLPEFSMDDLMRVFYVMVRQAGGVTCSIAILKNNVPKDFLNNIKIERDESKDLYRITIKQKRRRSILRPGTKIIRSN